MFTFIALFIAGLLIGYAFRSSTIVVADNTEILNKLNELESKIDSIEATVEIIESDLNPDITE